MRPICACLLLALALPASAEIYRYTDARGNTVYTNQPPQGVASESVQLAPTNTVATPKPTGSLQPPTDAAVPAGYSRVEIVGVPDDAEAVRSNAGDLSVGVELQPALHDGDQLQLLLDGQPVAPAGAQTRFALRNLDRGTHSLQAVVLREGAPLQSSASVSFTVQRVHLRPAQH